MGSKRDSLPQRISQADYARASRQRALQLLLCNRPMQSSDAQHDLVHWRSPVAANPSQLSDTEILKLGVDSSKSDEIRQEELRSEEREDHGGYDDQDGNAVPRLKRNSVRKPNDIQGHGALIAIEAMDANGKFAVLVVSENTETVVGKTPAELFALQSFLDILEDKQTNEFVDRVNLLEDTTAEQSTNKPEVFSLRIVSPRGRRPLRLWCALHLVATKGNIIICEFEPDEIEIPASPLAQNVLSGDVRNASNMSSDILSCKSHTEQPQRLTRASKAYQSGIRERGQVVDTRVLRSMSSVEAKLAAAQDLTRLSEVLVKIVEQITGFERVMIQRSDGNGNGRMYTDLVNPRISQYVKEPNFPVEDVPIELRGSLSLQEDQLLYDRKSPNARLLYRASDATDPPLDLTSSYLRVMPPSLMAHAERLNVRSLMSISINLPTGAWGWIVCHSYGTTVTRTPFLSRKLCRFVSNVAARIVQNLLSKWHIQAWKDFDTIFLGRHMNHRSAAASENLLRLFQADFGVLSIGPKTKILGHIHRAEEALVLLEYFKIWGTRSVTASSDIKREFPKLKYKPGFRGIAEALVIPVVNKSGGMFLLFRGPQSHNRETPRIREKLRGSGSRPVSHKRGSWTDSQMEAANVLCSMPDGFIQAWAEEDALPLSRMTQLLLDNLAHDIRTPLNAIVNYIEVALEGPLDLETRRLLDASHAASGDLICAVGNLSRTFNP